MNLKEFCEKYMAGASSSTWSTEQLKLIERFQSMIDSSQLQVGTLAKYFYRVEADGQVIMVGFQTYEELLQYIAPTKFDYPDEPHVR
jgi:hypothetical protein